MMERDRPPSTKISMPLADPVLPRERLYRKLDRARKRPLVWVEGPGGSGKTTLVSNYVDSRELHCLWYRVDPDDLDPGTFFHYMAMAGKLADPGAKKELSLFTPEYMNSVDQFSRRFFEDLFPLLKIPGVVVLDNFENVPQESYLVKVLQQAITRIPRDVRLFVVSRMAPPDDLARLRTNRKLQHVSWDDLKLDRDECEGILSVHGIRDIPRDDVARLNERVDGWVAGLTIIAESMDGKGVLPEESEAASREIMFGYYAAEVWQKLDPSVRELLLKVCFFFRMTADMAQSISGNNDTPAILKQLTEGNLFTVRFPGTSPFYQFHSLFREFLQARALKDLGSERVTTLRKKAAGILAAEGHTEAAIKLSLEVKDWSGAANLIKIQAQELFQQGRFRTLESWLGALPEALQESDPWLQYWQGSCSLLTDPLGAKTLFEKAHRLFDETGDAAGVYLTWAGEADTHIHGHQYLDSLDVLMEGLDEIRSKYPEYPSPVVEMKVTITVIQALTSRHPYKVDAGKWCARALELADQIDDPALSTHAVMFVAYLEICLGNNVRAKMLVENLPEDLDTLAIGPLSIIMVIIVRCLVSWLDNDKDGCLKQVERGRKVADEHGIPLWQNMLLGHGIACCLDHGDVAGANRFFGDVEKRLPFSSPIEKAYYHFLKSWHKLMENDTASALEHALVAHKITESTGVIFADALDNMAVVESAYENGDAKTALKHLVNLIQLADHMDCTHLKQAYHFLQARMALDTGNEREGLDYLKTAMLLGKENGYSNYYFWREPVMSRLCAKALETGIEKDYVRWLIKKRKWAPHGSLDELEAWPWPVRVYTLGRFKVVVNDKTLVSEARGKQKQLDLLKVIIAMGGRKVPVEQIYDALWPDADGATAHQSFSVTLHRLRKWIGVEDALVLREGSVSLNPGCCWVDSWALERLLSSFSNALEKVQAGDDAGLDSLAAKLMDMYRGQFMAGDADQPWAIAQNERIRNRFLRTASNYCRHLQSRDRYEEAIGCYERLLEVEPLAEDLYRNLMSCYLKFGRLSEGIQVCKRCRKVLDEVLGTKPSPKTEEICSQLRSMK